MEERDLQKEAEELLAKIEDVDNYDEIEVDDELLDYILDNLHQEEIEDD